MTVAELIAELQKLDPDAEVYWDPGFGAWEVSEVKYDHDRVELS